MPAAAWAAGSSPEPRAPVQPDANCQAARSAAAAASVPKHGQVVTMSVTEAPQTCYTQQEDLQNWWKRDKSTTGMLPEEGTFIEGKE